MSLFDVRSSLSHHRRTIRCRYSVNSIMLYLFYLTLNVHHYVVLPTALGSGSAPTGQPSRTKTKCVPKSLSESITLRILTRHFCAVMQRANSVTSVFYEDCELRIHKYGLSDGILVGLARIIYS